MLLFGHTGITAGIVKACDILASKGQPANSYEPISSSQFMLAVHKRLLPLYRLPNRIRCRLGSIDYRWVLLGSLLPDILDKPMWLFAFGDIFPTGRAWGHTFLFNFLLFIFGLILLKYKKSGLLVISLCSFTHLLLDEMWKNPVTLWWPLLGRFRKVETVGWMSGLLHSLFTDPGTYIPEIIGLAVILLFGYRLIVGKNITSFVETGAIR